MTKKSFPHQINLPLLLLILATAFLLRVWGLDFGLPYEFHPDEHQYVDDALNWHLTGQWDLSFINPPLFTYILTAALWPWLRLSPYVAAEPWITATVFYARLWSAGFSLLTVALAYPTTRRLAGRNAGIIASALLAGLFLPAREAHFAVTDSTAAFFVLLAIYFALRLLVRPTLGSYLNTGAAVGLATSAKLTGGLTLLPLLVAHVLGRRPKSIKMAIFAPAARYLALGLLLAGAIFLTVSAHIIADVGSFLETIIEHLRFGSEGYKGLAMTPTNGWLFYLGVLGWGIGWPLTIIIVISLLLGIWQRKDAFWVLTLMPLTLFIYMGSQEILFARFLLPAVPPLVILAAACLSQTRQQARLPHFLWPAVVGLLLVQPLAYTLRFDYLLTLPDTRELATRWLQQEIPEETVITKESYSALPPLFFTGKRWPYKIIQLNERGPAANNIDYYVSHKTQLIMTSNFTNARPRADQTAEHARLAQITQLEFQADLIKTFSPYRADPPGWFYLDELYGPAGELLRRTRPGPLIKIYRLPYENQPRTIRQPDIPNPLEANFGNKMVLLGYDLPTRRAEAGGSLPVTLYWQALDRMETPHVIFTRLLDARQQPWGGYDRWPQETANTILWHPGEIVVDTFNLPVAPDAPDGIYTIDIGLYPQSDTQAVPLPLVQNGQPIERNSVRLGPVKIGTGPQTTTATLPQTELGLELGAPPVIRLLGYDLAQQPDALRLTLYWESIAPTSTDWSIFTHLRGASSGETVAQKDGPAGSGQHPTSLWDPGDVVVDTLSIPLPEESSGGTLVIGLYDLADGTRLAVPDSPNSEIMLTTWERSGS